MRVMDQYTMVTNLLLLFVTIVSKRIYKTQHFFITVTICMLDFINLPSRFSYYDTETKLVGRYKRYQFVVDFFKKLGFKPSESNFGPEFEQSFIFEMYEGFLEIKFSFLHLQSQTGKQTAS